MTDQIKEAVSPLFSQGHRITINEAIELKPEDRERLTRVEQKLDSLLTNLEDMKTNYEQDSKTEDPWYIKVNWTRIVIASALGAAIVANHDNLPMLEKLLNLSAMFLI